MSDNEDLENELVAIDFRLQDVISQIERLQREKKALLTQRNDVQNKIHLKKSKELAARNWDSLEGNFNIYL